MAKKVDGKQLAEVGFEKIGTPYSEMDCQAFIEWCLRKCGVNKDLAGSNAWYRECIKNGAVMTPEECVAQLGSVPQGAFLFIHAYDGGEEKRGYHDGLGNASHIGICTGKKGKGAIHSSQSKGCVCESAFKGKAINGGWNMVGLWTAAIAFDYVDGGLSPSPSSTSNPFPTLRRGDRGEYVTLAQTKLIQKGYSCGASGADGIFGRATENAVYALQYDFCIGADGIIGAKTWEILNQTEEPELFSVTIDGLTEAQADALIQQYPNAVKGRG